MNNDQVLLPLKRSQSRIPPLNVNDGYAGSDISRVQPMQVLNQESAPQPTPEQKEEDFYTKALGLMQENQSRRNHGTAYKNIANLGASMRQDEMGARNQDIQTGQQGVNSISSMLRDAAAAEAARDARRRLTGGLSAAAGV